MPDAGLPQLRDMSLMMFDKIVEILWIEARITLRYPLVKLFLIRFLCVLCPRIQQSSFLEGLFPRA